VFLRNNKRITDNIKDIHRIIAMEQSSVADQYAIFQTGGKQYQAVKGKTLAIEKIEGEIGAQIEFDKVIFRKKGEDSFDIGTPFVDDSIKASIVKHTKGPKLIVFKFKRRKKVRVKKGHRQSLTVVRIESI